MAKKTRGRLQALLNQSKDSEEQTDTASNVTEPLQEGSNERPQDHSKAFSFPGLIEHTERMALQLPVSKKTVTCMLHSIDPRFARAHPLNPRHQQLISKDDPAVVELVRSMSEEGQREPVLAQLGQDGIWDIIYGTRRRFAAEQIHSARLEEGGFALRAWVPGEDLPQQDIQTLAISENEERENLSVWEKAKLIEGLDASGNFTKKRIGEMVRLHEKNVIKYSGLSEIPEQLVALLVSPSEFTLAGGSALRRLAVELGGYQTMTRELAKQGRRYESMGSLLSEARKLAKPKKQKASVKSRGKQEIKDADGNVKFLIGRVRGKEAGAAKIDAFGLSDEDFISLMKVLESFVK